MPKHKLTFKEFEHHTEDAWDAADDDLIRDAASKFSIHPEHVKVLDFCDHPNSYHRMGREVVFLWKRYVT